jgi:hypothetical protein
MPQDFTGKVTIPGDQIEAYLAALAEAEERRRPFRQYLDGLRAEFEQHLAARYSRKTVRKHAQIVALFVDFLCDWHQGNRAMAEAGLYAHTSGRHLAPDAGGFAGVGAHAGVGAQARVGAQAGGIARAEHTGRGLLQPVE